MSTFFIYASWALTTTIAVPLVFRGKMRSWTQTCFILAVFVQMTFGVCFAVLQNTMVATSGPAIQLVSPAAVILGVCLIPLSRQGRSMLFEFAFVAVDLPKFAYTLVKRAFVEVETLPFDNESYKARKALKQSWNAVM